MKSARAPLARSLPATAPRTARVAEDLVVALGLALGVAGAGCGKAPACAEGTLYVTLALSSTAQAADTLDLALAIDGQPVQHRRAARRPGQASDLVQIGFAGDYPAGRSLALTIEALAGDTVLGSAAATFPAQPGCTALGLELAPPAVSDAGGDGSPSPNAGDGAAPGDDLSAGDDSSVLSDSSVVSDLTAGGDLAIVSDLAVGQVQLLALAPSTANTGDTLTLEGTFGATATVNFPGGATQAATVLGAHRATVTVPAGATTGDLTVTSLGATSDALPFRRAPFALGLQGFQVEAEQGDGPRVTPALVAPRVGANALVYGSGLYVIGGQLGSDSGIKTSIERAGINADGTLSSFVTLASSLTTARSHACAVVLGSTLYLLGGTGPAGALATVERATFNADGSLSTFAAAGALTAARTGAVCFVAGNSLYVAGGYSGGYSLTVERATIGPDDSLSAFTAVPGVQLVAGHERGVSAVVGDQVYVLGGNGSGGYTTAVERAAINADGSLSTFANVAGVSLQTGRDTPLLLQTPDELYLAGGNQGATALSSVERATLGAGGALSTFSTATGLTLAAPVPAYASGAVAGDYFYVVAGSSSDGRTQHASLNASGALGAFANNTGVSLKTARTTASSALSGNHLYVIGGWDGDQRPRSVEHAIIAPDGTLSAFQTLSSQLGTARSYQRSAVLGNKLYVFGGYNGNNGLGSVEAATINADGTLSSFANATGVDLQTARYAPSIVVLGNYLYLIGGYGNNFNNLLGSVERAAIGADGTLGDFATVSSALTTARSEAASVVLGSSLYVLGGYNGGNLDSIEVATIGADGSLGSFSKLTGRLSSERAAAVAAVIGPSLYLVGGSTTSIDRAPIGLDRGPGSFSLLAGAGSSLPALRAYPVSLLAGNLLSLVGGGSANGDSAYTTVYQGALQ